ncbi:MAG: 50S ribosomal protein L5 [Candidatus Magasanikbacteria bacterium RIFCSPLOWO2_02_FULL_44_11]|uniref:Large ribosomal subunit protein uL5 n=2 Tax=Candidatus Magasanikiibacteriota TaxID=1752731 RepID=A0A1F6N9T4_9BACT|nr:MAG: 50S ribosomal protein L5 [Candidatus Magasanikbacteria bacterium RIFCSPHIGHO2_02_FULL_45_10]OGH80538.1 MAG: 50S ribosomal protein L5 [Candidatus Magasanikbacteria bacterium RIFCSPLOWO2_02_FULL_44_11]
MSLYQTYKKSVVPAIQKELGLKNVMQVPKVTKVVLNAGIGRFIKEANFIDNVEKTLTKITGQKPIRTKAKKAISNFKIREGQEIGVMVTLRGPRMYDFLEKLVKVTFPRVRDFHGISDKAFDGQGNFTIGFKENVAFPEVKMEEIDKIHGLQIIVNTTAKNKVAGKSLLTHLGFPFSKK